MKLTTKEQVIYFMSTKINLGTYDKRFIDNILNKINVTTNQATLLDKIINRYHKQFLKQDLNSVELLNLPWKNNPIQSSPQYTEVWLSIENDEIIIKTPYNTSFIKELKRLPFDVNWHNIDETSKHWSTGFSAYTLKSIISLTNEHFTNINYCDNCKQIIDYLANFEKEKYWDPTLVVKHDVAMVYALNEPLYLNIKEYDNTNIDIRYVSKLVQYGIKMDTSVYSQIIPLIPLDLELDIALKFIINYESEMDVHDTNTLLKYLNMIKCDLVVLGPTITKKSIFKENIIAVLKENSIRYITALGKAQDITMHINVNDNVVYLDFDYSFVTTPQKLPFVKVMKMVNNYPVKL